jgi:pimeloyl-ACP methyl ester carboxylesterase
VKGGAYTAEQFALDVDAAVAEIGSTALVGAGLGAYIALLFSAARPDRVTSALLLPGVGLDGGGPQPYTRELPRSIADSAVARGEADPMVCFAEHDVRPPDYAATFARKARKLILLEDGGPRPPWWQAVRTVPGVRVVASIADGLAAL